VSWLGPTIAAWPLHWFWFLNRIIGAGVLDREGQIVALRNAAMQFGIVSVGHVVLWVIVGRVPTGRLTSACSRRRRVQCRAAAAEAQRWADELTV
jgi:hypothetical protein